MKNLLTALLTFFILTSINAQSKRPMTVDDLWAMKRIKNYDVSVDGKSIVFQVESYNMEANTKQNDIWMINSDGTNLRPVKNSDESESNPKFTPDGKNITYQLAGQIWQCNLNGQNDVQLIDLYTGASGIKWSSDGEKFLFVSEVYPDCETQDCNKNKDEQKAASKVNVIVADDLPFRDWDHWRGEKRTHVFLMDWKNQKHFDLANKSDHSIPTEFLGSSNDYNISPDGNEVAFCANFDEDLSTSTNNDIFILDLNSFLQSSKLTQVDR